MKGRFGYDYVNHPDRLTRPMVRKYLLDGSPRPEGRGEWVEVDWDTALEITARKLRAARDQHGADTVGVFDLRQVHQRRKLPDEQARQAGDRDE